MFGRLSRQLRARRRTPPRTLASLDAYARWADSYPPHAHNALMQAEQASVCAMLDTLAIEGSTALDLACGTGRYTQVLSARGARQVISLDNSMEMLRAGQREGGLPSAGLATLAQLPLRSASVDVLVCGLAVGHIAALWDLFRETHRILRPEGAAIISDFHPFLFLTQRKRTFTVHGETFAVEHFAHLYEDIHTAAAGAHLTIDALAEPRLDVEEQRLPAVLVYRLRKGAL